MATPQPTLEDVKIMQIKDLGVESLTFILTEGSDNFQPPETAQRVTNRLVDGDVDYGFGVGTQTLFALDWLEETAYGGTFNMLAVDTSAAQRGNTYQFSGRFTAKKVNGTKSILTPIIEQLYDQLPMTFNIIDLNPGDPLGQLAFQITSPAGIKTVVTFYTLIIKLDISAVSSD